MFPPRSEAPTMQWKFREADLSQDSLSLWCKLNWCFTGFCIFDIHWLFLPRLRSSQMVTPALFEAEGSLWDHEIVSGGCLDLRKSRGKCEWLFPVLRILATMIFLKSVRRTNELVVIVNWHGTSVAQVRMFPKSSPTTTRPFPSPG